MTPEQKEHVQLLKDRFAEMMAAKYEAGVKEHGGNLWEHDPLYLLDQAIFENIDQFTYLTTLRQQLSGELGPYAQYCKDYKDLAHQHTLSCWMRKA